jgi:hypothetical protein
MKLLFKSALRYSSELGKVAAEFKFDRYTTLQVFGIGKLPGMNRRPRFLMQKHTEVLIAINALKYANTPAEDRPHRNKSNDNTLTLSTTYEQIRCRPLYQSPEVLELNLQLYLKSKGRTRLRARTGVDKILCTANNRGTTADANTSATRPASII